MSILNDGGPAFPTIETLYDPETKKWSGPEGLCGMSLRAYAAIQLRVPDSGIDWLNEMITKAQPVKLTDAQLDRIAIDLWDRPFPDAVTGDATP